MDPGVTGVVRREWSPCGLLIDGAICGSFDDVKRTLAGLRCRAHRAKIPDPAASVQPSITRESREYGAATDDPLGRTVTRDASGKRFDSRLPKRPCPRCNDRGDRSAPVGHKGPHDFD